MRWLLSLIFVIVTLSSTSATETKTEFITEEVCHAVAGCWIDPRTGECPDCVTETRKIVTVIEKEPIFEIESKSSEIVAKKTIPKKEGKCWFAEAGWPTGELTEDFKPIMTGGYMPCGWRS
tara:strand:- start:1746 stop:2108 length:363 start_codon:yes stop_codon:yes gene_type:complete